MPPPPSETAAAPAGDARAQVGQVAAELQSFLAGSETVFLEAGTSLQVLEGQARRLIEVASAAASQSAAGVEGPVERLGQELGLMLQHLDASKHATRDGIAGLGRLLGKVDGLQTFDGEFREIASTLQVLGMHTVIENATSTVRLQTVAQDVRRLAGRIVPTFDTVLAQARKLREGASRAREAAEQFLRQQGESAAGMLAGTRRDLAALQDLAARSTELARRASGSLDKVAANVGGVLVALQMHDTIRQMMEHVVEELQGLQGDTEETEPEWNAEAAELCRLEARQLRSARERLVRALEQIGLDLKVLSAGVAELAGEARRLVGSDDHGAMLASVVGGIGRSTQVLRGQLNQERETAAAVEGVAEAVKGMSGCVRDIQVIGSEVKLIAMNAMVQTTRAGSTAMAFSVLARAMMDLSVTVGERTGVVIGGLQKIGEEVEALRRSGAQELAEVASGGGIAADLEAVLDGLRGYHDQLMESVETLLQGSTSLGQAVAQLAGRLEGEAQVAGALEGLEQLLERVADEAERRAPGGASRGSRRVQAAAARYTMEAERAVHQVAAPPRDLAMPPPPAGAALGDNVELF